MLPNTVILPGAKPKKISEKVTPPPSPPNIVTKIRSDKKSICFGPGKILAILNAVCSAFFLLK